MPDPTATARVDPAARDHIRMVAHARETYARHEIRERDDEHHRWVLSRRSGTRWQIDYTTEVVALNFGLLYVGGGINSVVFGYGHGRGLDLVRWIGETEDVEYYVAQKARIGMGDPRGHVTSDWSWSACEADARYLLDELRTRDARLAAALCEVLSQDSPGSREVFLDRALDALSKHDGHMDGMKSFASLGVRIAWRVVYAHAALRRLLELLEAK